MSNYQYDPLVLLSEMPAVQEEVLVVSAEMARALQNQPRRVPLVFEINSHPALDIYGDADNYKDCPNIGHC